MDAAITRFSMETTRRHVSCARYRSSRRTSSVVQLSYNSSTTVKAASCEVRYANHPATLHLLVPCTRLGKGTPSLARLVKFVAFPQKKPSSVRRSIEGCFGCTHKCAQSCTSVAKRHSRRRCYRLWRPSSLRKLAQILPGLRVYGLRCTRRDLRTVRR